MIECPLCHHPTVIKLIENEKVVVCPSCGAHKDINRDSGNIIWIRNGRILLAKEDVALQRKKHKERYGYV